MDSRPFLTKNTTLKDFKDFYWLKKELVDFCKKNLLPTSGSKEVLTERIVEFLKTGEVSRVQKVSSKKDSLVLALNAKLTTNYSNGEEVRAFFKKHIGKRFKFTVGLMKFCRENPEKTFSDAIKFWLNEQEEKKDPRYKKVIGKQFEYNQYIHDFMTDNRNLPLQDAIICWKEKKAQRGNNVYSKEDLQFLD